MCCAALLGLLPLEFTTSSAEKNGKLCPLIFLNNFFK